MLSQVMRVLLVLCLVSLCVSENVAALEEDPTLEFYDLKYDFTISVPKAGGVLRSSASIRPNTTRKSTSSMRVNRGSHRKKTRVTTTRTNNNHNNLNAALPAKLTQKK